MFKNIKSILLVALVALTIGCADENLKPIITYDDATKGAYVARVATAGGDIGSDDPAGSKYVYSVEFIDVEGGKTVTDYELDVKFTDFNLSDGDSSAGPVNLRSFTSSDFTTMESGNVGMKDITITGQDLLTALGLSADDIKGGGKFDVIGTLKTSSGGVHRANNSSASVNGSAFRGHFNYTLNVVCPSELAGTYASKAVGKSTDGCCPNQTTLEREIVLAANTDGDAVGVYDISDWSGGLYFEWYDVYGIKGPQNTKGQIKDACGVISFITDAEPFGEWVKGSGQVADDGSIEYKWENGYGDKGTVTLTK